MAMNHEAVVVPKQVIGVHGKIRLIEHTPDVIGMSAENFNSLVEGYYLQIRDAAKNILDSDRRNAFKRERLSALDNLFGGAVTDILEYKNLTCTVGRTEQAKSLANDSPGATYLEYCAVGTNATAPSAADTTLNTELFRKLITLLTRSGASAEARTFLTTSEGNGTLLEVGHFLNDATAAANSGTLMNRALISKTKTSSITLTIVQTFDINDA